MSRARAGSGYDVPITWLKDNWLWVAIPALLMVAIVILAVVFGPSEQDPNGYSLR